MLLLLVHLLALGIAALMLNIQAALIVLRLYYSVVYFLVFAIQCICAGLDFLVRQSVASCMPGMPASLQRH